MKAEYGHQRWVDGRCSSGKRGFMDRGGAKYAARWEAKTGTPGLRPYACDECGNWHIGHKPEPVKRGEVTAEEWYRR